MHFINFSLLLRQNPEFQFFTEDGQSVVHDHELNDYRSTFIAEGTAALSIFTSDLVTAFIGGDGGCSSSPTR